MIFKQEINKYEIIMEDNEVCIPLDSSSIFLLVITELNKIVNLYSDKINISVSLQKLHY